VAGNAGQFPVGAEMKIFGNFHGGTDADTVVEVVLQGCFMAFLAQAVDVLPKDFLLDPLAGAGNEKVTMRAADGLKIVRVAITGTVHWKNKRNKQQQRDSRLFHDRISGAGNT
jgi:hypothetical protein